MARLGVGERKMRSAHLDLVGKLQSGQRMPQEISSAIVDSACRETDGSTKPYESHCLNAHDAVFLWINGEDASR